MRIGRALRTVLAGTVLAACATTGASGEGDRDLPSAGVGPFRKLGDEEVSGIAPFVFDRPDDGFGEPAVLDEGADVLLFAAAVRDGVDVIVRSRATDGRNFYGTSGDSARTAPVVLAPEDGSAGWETGGVRSPFALRALGTVLLYYAADAGIGVARAADAFTFTKVPGPVLARDPAYPLETTPPGAPTAYVGDDARVHLFYTSGSSIFEAVSEDGVHFQRLDPDPSTAALEPVFGPSPRPAPGALLPNEKPPFDTGGVGDPSASVGRTPAGRSVVRVLYTGRDDQGTTAIGFAARFGDAGPLSRNAAPVYSVKQGEAAPALLQTDDRSMLYVQQNRRRFGDDFYRAIAAAVAPVDLTLPKPAPFPERP